MGKSLGSGHFKGLTGQWYIENSLTTLNQKDPVSEHNTKLWNTGLESDKGFDLVNKKENYNTFQTSMLLVILNTQRMKVKCFCSDMVKKYLIRLLQIMSPEFEDEANQPI